MDAKATEADCLGTVEVGSTVFGKSSGASPVALVIMISSVFCLGADMAAHHTYLLTTKRNIMMAIKSGNISVRNFQNQEPYPW